MNHSSFFRFRPARHSRNSVHSARSGAEPGAPVPEPASPGATDALRGILRPGTGGLVQRMCKSCEEEEVQRKARPGGDAAPEAASAVASGSGSAGGPALDSGLQQDIAASGSAGRPLPGPLRRSFEDRFGSDLGGVRVVTGDSAARLNDSLDARAFTVGNHIWFGRGEYRPDSASGQRLLAHELTHTLQQGGGSRGAGAQGPQTSLRLGSSSDPAEAEADRVADAVMQGGNPGTVRRQARGAARTLRRQLRSCTVTRGAEDNQLLADCGSDRYRVTFSVDRTREPETRVEGRPGIDFSNVWFDLEICRGNTRVRVRPSLNVTGALRDMLGNIISGSPVMDDITADPDLELEITISETFSGTIGGGPFIDPLSGDVIGGGVRLTIPTERAPRVDCTRERLYLRMRCERLTTVPAVPARPAVTHDEHRHLYLLFPHAQSSPVNEVRMGVEDASPAILADPALAVQELAGQGFRVTAIEGFTSPEGPRAQGRRFQGNDALGQERADAAQAWLTDNCPSCGAAEISPVGRSELYSPTVSPETEGDALTRAATPPFLAADPLRPATEEERAALAGGSTREQRARIYPLLRRAHVALERTVEDEPARPAVPEREDSEVVGCPDMVRQAVRDFLGIL